jgi:hypothetical protein
MARSRAAAVPPTVSAAALNLHGPLFRDVGPFGEEKKMESKKPRLLGVTLVMLATLVAAPALGAIDAFRAYRNQDLSSALTAVGIYLVAAPLIALWWLHQHPVSRD